MTSQKLSHLSDSKVKFRRKNTGVGMTPPSPFVACVGSNSSFTHVLILNRSIDWNYCAAVRFQESNFVALIVDSGLRSYLDDGHTVRYAPRDMTSCGVNDVTSTNDVSRCDISDDRLLAGHYRRRPTTVQVHNNNCCVFSAFRFVRRLFRVYWLVTCNVLAITDL